MNNNVTKNLKEQSDYLKNIINKLNGRAGGYPDGNLIIERRSEKRIEYSKEIRDNTSGKRKRIYLKRNDTETIQALAQKCYDRKLLKAAEYQENVISSFLDNYDPNVLKTIYSFMTDERKDLVNAEVIDDEEYAAAWQAVSYTKKGFAPDEPEYYSARGERVRSKSEVIIADTLFREGIPYRYECPIVMPNGRIWHPDFLVLNKTERKEYILEHFGMMDDPDYAENTVAKLQFYMQSGIYYGDKLLYTMESRKCPLSTKVLDNIIQRYLK